MHFLNAVLDSSPRITRATILNPILGKETDEDKLSILDVRAEDEFGRQFNIEMQTSLAIGLSQRLVYYASCLYVGQLNEGDPYHGLRPAISICVLEQALFPQVPRLHLDFRLRDVGGCDQAQKEHRPLRQLMDLSPFLGQSWMSPLLSLSSQFLNDQSQC